MRWALTAGHLVASGVGGRRCVRRKPTGPRSATAAELLGLAERMIGMAADYAKERHQFGKPIGSFQAVKHLLAGAQVKLEFARPVVYGAAWALDKDEPTAVAGGLHGQGAGPPRPPPKRARVALQVHGAIGYTWECDLHLFLKRAWALSRGMGFGCRSPPAVLAG